MLIVPEVVPSLHKLDVVVTDCRWPVEFVNESDWFPFSDAVKFVVLLSVCT